MILGKLAPDYSLAKLRDMLNIYEGLWGPLLTLRNDGTDTVGDFDETATATAAATQKIVLRPGSANPGHDETAITTGTVFILNQLQQVTAYRT